MPGPKPKPTKLKQLQGNPGKRAINHSEPQFTGNPTCPAWLTKVARAEWKRIVAELEHIGMLSAVDSSALAGYCQSYARWQEAEALVDKHGIMVEEPVVSKAGELLGVRLKRNPADIARRDALKAMQSFATLFGFDPSSRSRLHVPEKTSDPFATFMETLISDESEPAQVN